MELPKAILELIAVEYAIARDSDDKSNLAKIERIFPKIPYSQMVYITAERELPTEAEYTEIQYQGRLAIIAGQILNIT